MKEDQRLWILDRRIRSSATCGCGADGKVAAKDERRSKEKKVLFPPQAFACNLVLGNKLRLGRRKEPKLENAKKKSRKAAPN